MEGRGGEGKEGRGGEGRREGRGGEGGEGRGRREGRAMRSSRKRQCSAKMQQNPHTSSSVYFHIPHPPTHPHTLAIWLPVKKRSFTPLDAHCHGTASVCRPFSVASSLRSLSKEGEGGGEREGREGGGEREGREGGGEREGREGGGEREGGREGERGRRRDEKAATQHGLATIQGPCCTPYVHYSILNLTVSGF